MGSGQEQVRQSAWTPQQRRVRLVLNRRESVPRLFILGAGRPYQGVKPSALVHTSSNQVVLDWIIAAFKQVGKFEVHFMGGYGVDQIAEEFPTVDIIFNPDWSRTGSGDSMLRAPFDPESDNYVCYGDTVISPDAVRLLADTQGDVVIGVDSGWQSRYEARARSDRK